ncbi:MAG: DUF1987 domain-containing protein [Bacteroidales bacterium]|nr:DUF1987 domain-containing protein [Bacteroidales bacterium]
MEPLIIHLTDSTPSIHLDKVSGKFEISGRSLPEEALAFYQPVLEWINAYIDTPNENTAFVFKMDYINSASVRALNDILTILEKLFLKGNNVSIVWKFSLEDKELKETGEEFSEIYKMPFKLEGYTEN